MENILNDRKKQWIFIVGIYGIAVLVYGLATAQMSVPVHLLADEDICLSLAKSFHHDGSFMKGYHYTSYNCILYSVLISVGYFFYTPATILFIIRLINVLVMCSAVFPIFLLAKRILPIRRAVMISVFCMFLPDMIDSCYIMQEVLFFPVLMWCFYFVYRDLEAEKCFNRYAIIATILITVEFFVKTNGFVLIAAYIFLIILIEHDRKRAVLKCVLTGGIWCILTVLLEIWILFANGGNQGQNHYASQIMRLFPIGWNTIYAGMSGLLYYTVFFIFCMGIIPVIFPGIYRKKYTKMERGLLLFTYSAIVLMIIEIVVTIFLTEESGGLVPHKFLFRYFFGFGVPLLILLLKLEKGEWRGKKLIYIMYGGIGVYIAGYYWIVGNGTRTSIMDSHVTLLIENVNKYLIPGFPIYCMMLFLIGSLFALGWIFRKKDVHFLLCCFWKITCVATITLCVINLFQHPFYSNQIVGGRTREPDFIKVADYLGKGGDVKVYFMSEELDNSALIYGYLWQDYQWIYSAGEIDRQEKCVVVTSAGRYEKIDGFHKSNLHTESVDLWVRDNERMG